MMPGRVIPKLQRFIPYNGKIADITHVDTDIHYLDLETALTETRKIVAIILTTERVAGTGQLYVYPNDGNNYIAYALPTRFGIVTIADGTQRLKYALEDANDDFDLRCNGYVVEA